MGQQLFLSSTNTFCACRSPCTIVGRELIVHVFKCSTVSSTLSQPSLVKSHTHERRSPQFPGKGSPSPTFSKCHSNRSPKLWVIGSRSLTRYQLPKRSSNRP